MRQTSFIDFGSVRIATEWKIINTEPYCDFNHRGHFRWQHSLILNLTVFLSFQLRPFCLDHFVLIRYPVLLFCQNQASAVQQTTPRYHVSTNLRSHRQGTEQTCVCGSTPWSNLLASRVSCMQGMAFHLWRTALEWSYQADSWNTHSVW